MMKRKYMTWVCIAVVLVLLGFFASIFIRYAQPMKNDHFNLSLASTKDEFTGVDHSGELGWTVYTQEGDAVTPLVFDGLGCYEGLQYLGQTFYYSRVMQEKLSSPSLSLSPIDRNFSVFLDGELIYTDCPAEDNRIGYLTLPARQPERDEEITIALPGDYLGKTLTIAQSTPPYTETPRMATRVIPSTVNLYCSYAYESELIAESFRTAYVSSAAYAVGLVLLGFFVLSLFGSEPDMSLLLLALTLFLTMAAMMYDTSYQMKYFGVPQAVSTTIICQCLATDALLFFLAFKARRTRIAAWATAIVSLAVDLAYIGLLLAQRLDPIATAGRIKAFLCLPVLIAAIVLSWVEFRKPQSFHRWFAPLSTAGIAACVVLKLTAPGRSDFLTALRNSFDNLTFNTYSWPITSILLMLCLGITLVHLIHDGMNAHAEKRLMKEMTAMAQQRYENLRSHNEEVMMLRHDMNRHFQVLRQTTTDANTAAYLDELLDKNAKIRSVISSGNDMLDTILCGRLSTAADAGIHVEVLRADAPDTLPITNTDLCSLVMNLMDNAIAAASAAETPFIRLDLHRKSDFFVFVCENSMGAGQTSAETEKTVPKHGLGLKIIRQIAERYGHLLTTEAADDTYKVSLAIPLSQPSR